MTVFPLMARLVELQVLLWTTVAVICPLGGMGVCGGVTEDCHRQLSESLREGDRRQETGFSVEVLRTVFAATGQNGSIEGFPTNP
jgi:hypothetical protein